MDDLPDFRRTVCSCMNGLVGRRRSATRTPKELYNAFAPVIAEPKALPIPPTDEPDEPDNP